MNIDDQLKNLPAFTGDPSVLPSAEKILSEKLKQFPAVDVTEDLERLEKENASGS